jgi:hypothetical protein
MSVRVLLCAGMPDCPASDQSGTGMKKTNDVGTGLVLTKPMKSGIFSVWYRTEIITCRNANAGVNLLDADAQLCPLM